MSVQNAKKGLRAAQTALDKLNGEKAKVLQSLEALQKDRSVAARDLAAGDESKEETILNLEAEIGPLSVRLEGLDTLIQEAEEKVEAAAAVFEEAKAEYDQALAEFVAAREAEDIENLRASLPKRKQRLLDLYASFLEALGEFQVDSFRFGNGQHQVAITDFTARLQGSLHETMKAKRLRPLMMPGYGGTVPVWSHVKLDDELSTQWPGIGPVNALNISNARMARRIAGYREEFEASYKG
jgi:chromosome segregation ATPase